MTDRAADDFPAIAARLRELEIERDTLAMRPPCLLGDTACTWPHCQCLAPDVVI